MTILLTTETGGYEQYNKQVDIICILIGWDEQVQELKLHSEKVDYWYTFGWSNYRPTVTTVMQKVKKWRKRNFG